MPASIGVNLRVTGHCSQGGRKYMEDLFSVAYQQTEDERDLEYAFFGIYDGHGGSEAAAFAKEHLMDSIVKQRQFWSDNDEDVLKAIRNGYMLTHLNMWKELEKWPKTVTGLPSTAGTTASVAFIRRGKIYIGHVGDSAIVLGYQKDGCEEWASKPLTLDHKPESTAEMERIQRCGGKVVSKAGVPRVVWNRPRAGHKGPIKKNTPMDEIPFLAVARSLGDLWSYNTNNDEFIVSPDPDVGVLNIDPSKFRCLIFGTDGLWNMISPEGAVSLVQATERHNEAALVGSNGGQPRDWLNPSKSLVDHALERWSNTRMRADNTSVVTLMLDPPGPPRATVLRARGPAPRAAAPPAPAAPPAAPAPTPQNGLTIMTRYSDLEKPTPAADTPLPPCATLDGRFSIGPHDDAAPDNDDSADNITNYGNPAESYFMARLLNRNRIVNTLSAVFDEIVNDNKGGEIREPSPAPVTSVTDDGGSEPKGRRAEPAETNPEDGGKSGDSSSASGEDGGIQINEVSSSSPIECPGRTRGRRGRGERREATSCARVLRSHDAQRPATRQAARRPPAVPTAAHAAPVLERVVILTRAPVTRSRDTLPSTPAPSLPPALKTTRSGGQAARELRSLSGNVRRGAAAGAGGGGCCKENCGRAGRRAEPEVHSTTGEPRALRSRNEPADPPPAKRTAPPPPAPPHKAPRLAPAPAPLTLRNRLRKRLIK